MAHWGQIITGVITKLANTESPDENLPYKETNVNIVRGSTHITHTHTPNGVLLVRGKLQVFHSSFNYLKVLLHKTIWKK